MFLSHSLHVNEHNSDKTVISFVKVIAAIRVLEHVLWNACKFLWGKQTGQSLSGKEAGRGSLIWICSNKISLLILAVLPFIIRWLRLIPPRNIEENYMKNCQLTKEKTKEFIVTSNLVTNGKIPHFFVFWIFISSICFFRFDFKGIIMNINCYSIGNAVSHLFKKNITKQF